VRRSSRQLHHSRRHTAKSLALAAAGTMLVGIGLIAFVVSCAPRSQTAAGLLPESAVPSVAAAEMATADIAGAQTAADISQVPGFDIQPAGTDERGWALYHVEIKSGGSPNLVAIEKLTPLFQVDGKDGPSYVGDSFFTQNPNRRPNTIQPGDEFTLALPPDAFIVRTQEDVLEQLGGTARVRLYTSERGDKLRYYLTDPFPLVYEMQQADSGQASLVLHRELPYQLSTGGTDIGRLAQLIYRVPDPDMFQMEAVKALAAKAVAGQSMVINVDRTHRYLDPVREAMLSAVAREAVPEPERAHLTRALFDDPARVPYAAVEDSLGSTTNPGELPNGRVFRIEYFWDGTVRVHYKTGDNDAMGKRNPFEHRENERWAALYERLSQTGDWPVRWSAAEPSDMAPFPSARDPRYKAPSEDQAYNYLVPGRIIVLTFKPTRTYAEAKADGAAFSALQDMREQFKEQINGARGLVEQLGVKDLLSSSQQSPRRRSGAQEAPPE
jgi:hypothetical protein